MAFSLTMLTVFAIFVAFAPPTLSTPVANDFGINDAEGYQGIYVLIPVNITNAQDGPIISVKFDMSYDDSVINVVDVYKGDLTSDWDSPSYNNFDWGTRISIVYDAADEHAIQEGSTGSVALLNFSVIGNPGETSIMNFSDIQLSDTGYDVGTAPAKNGTFTLLAFGSVHGRITDITGTEIDGVTVNLTMLSSGVVKTTTTNETGYYSFTNVESGNYDLNVSMPSFWKNSTTVTVGSGEIIAVDIILSKKGDLNNNGISADDSDLAMMKDASVGKISADRKYDLNTNGIYACAGDLAMMKDASMGKIELL